MPHPYSHPRRGWTWVEVMVVLAVVAVIVLLVLPAIQQSREAARRTQCRNSLKGIGLALSNYHDGFKTLPPGYVLDTDGPYLGWGWCVSLTPYMEATTRHGRLSEFTSSGINSLPQSAWFLKSVPGLSCPTDYPEYREDNYVPHVLVSTDSVTDGIVIPPTLDVPNHFARSNYFGVAGYLHAEVGGIAFDAGGEPAGKSPLVNAGSLGNIGTTFSVGHRYCDPANFRGVFGQNSWTKFDDIKDGLANTLLVGERYAPKNDGPGAVGHGTWVGVPDCSTAAGLAMALGDTAVKLNAGARTRAETTGFGSAHTGGSHFLFADGAVRFIRNEIDIGLYRSLSSIADGGPNPICDEF